MIFDLVKDFGDVLESMPHEHLRYPILKLLNESIRRDVHFIERHPTTLFQCLWNTCWWYDCEQLESHLVRSLSDRFRRLFAVAWQRSVGRRSRSPTPPTLCELAEHWESQKERHTPGFTWLRSLRPPRVSLDGRQLPLAGHGKYVKQLEVSPDGSRVLSAGEELWVGVWNGGSGRMLAELFLSNRSVTDFKFTPSGAWFAALSYYGRAMIAWDTRSLREISVPEAELSQLLFGHSRRPSRYRVGNDTVGAAILSDNGAAMAWYPSLCGWCSDASGRIWTALVHQYVGIYRLDGNL